MKCILRLQFELLCFMFWGARLWFSLHLTFPGKPFGSCALTSCRSGCSANGRALPYGTLANKAGSCTEASAQPIRRRSKLYVMWTRTRFTKASTLMRSPRKGLSQKSQYSTTKRPLRPLSSVLNWTWREVFLRIISTLCNWKKEKIIIISTDWIMSSRGLKNRLFRAK